MTSAPDLLRGWQGMSARHAAHPRSWGSAPLAHYVCAHGWPSETSASGGVRGDPARRPHPAQPAVPERDLGRAVDASRRWPRPRRGPAGRGRARDPRGDRARRHGRPHGPAVLRPPARRVAGGAPRGRPRAAHRVRRLGAGRRAGAAGRRGRRVHRRRRAGIALADVRSGKVPVVPLVLEALADHEPHQRQRVAAYAPGRRGTTRCCSPATPPAASHPGFWTLPGGGVDHGEPPRHALAREVQEECRAALHRGRPARRARRALRWDAPRRDATRTSTGCTCLRRHRPRGGEPRVTEADGTTDAVAWVPLADIESGVVPVLGLVTHALRFAKPPPVREGVPMSETVFTYAAPALKFGPGASAEIGYDLAAVRRPPRAAGHRRRGRRHRAPRADRRARSPSAASRSTTYDGVHVEPTDASMAAAIEFARDAGPFDAIVAVGGGLGDRHRQGGEPADHQPRRADGLHQRAGRQGAGARRSRCSRWSRSRPRPAPAARAPRSACSTCCRCT